MRVIVSYDIGTASNNGAKRLRNIAKTMKRFGFRIQKSVFETDLSLGQFQELIQITGDLIDPKEDSIVFFKIGDCCLSKAVRIGLAYDPLLKSNFIV